ncbi:hypothetical protein V8V91_04805 [Algoriphagus halophilus]|uniref:hypothetical protein n=1 Tax=Algoriphagus halophilus TaxID=226505 RepID=UPI00358F97F2
MFPEIPLESTLELALYKPEIIPLPELKLLCLIKLDERTFVVDKSKVGLVLFES